jgi:hypothetical protein
MNAVCETKRRPTPTARTDASDRAEIRTNAGDRADAKCGERADANCNDRAGARTDAGDRADAKCGERPDANCSDRAERRQEGVCVHVDRLRQAGVARGSSSEPHAPTHGQDAVSV